MLCITKGKECHGGQGWRCKVRVCGRKLEGLGGKDILEWVVLSPEVPKIHEAFCFSQEVPDSYHSIS